MNIYIFFILQSLYDFVMVKRLSIFIIKLLLIKENFIINNI